MQIKVFSLEQTQALAEQLAKNLCPGIVIALNGELGAGKTTFARFLARACGIVDNIHSPTFNLLNIYAGKIPFYHFDFYRLHSLEDIENIGGAEFIPAQDGITLIEWAENFSEVLLENYLEIQISADKEQRTFNFIFHGKAKDRLSSFSLLENMPNL